MKPLPIVWQRLVSEQGSTCPRCHDTGEAVQQAVRQLRQALEPLGIKPELQVQAIDAAAFLRDPLQSNQVLIAGRPMEHWLGAATGSSRCCNECGANECRTVEVDGQVHEAIPQELLVRAGLIAATRMLDPALPA
ncbi:DUF2703 domain-containing protein [Alicycliphilus denitrificans]|uniref:DUF2703 domain-containing protein n=1 Tax=Alicycliphilus denitrificans TaxID=179636 RepID=UPI00384CE41A